MKKEISKTDRDRIFTLKLMNDDLVDLLETQEKYIQRLFKHFQNDRYLETNFFKEGTIECEIYDFLDNMILKFEEFYKPFIYLKGKILYFLNQTSEETKRTKKCKKTT